ncbi:MAG: hypothetical protein M0Z66_00650 [Thermaerobacter sp.]|nr:hypothetical protein [Thermaerobacter sp.]
MQESQRRLLIGLLVAAIVVGAAAVGSRLASQAAATHPALTRAAQRLGSKAMVTFRVEGLGGRVDETTFPAVVLGVSRLTAEQLLSEMPGWTMKTAGGHVTLLPKSGADPLYLGVVQGQVALFFGPPRYGWVDQMTGLRASALRPADLARLTAGVPVESVGAAWQMLEGLGG